MKTSRACCFVALGITLAVAGCSSASPTSGDDEVGSPGGAFVPPHADAAADDDASAPNEGGVELYDAEPRESGAVDAAPPRDARPPMDAQSSGLDAGVHDAAPTGCVSLTFADAAGGFDVPLPTVTPLAGGEAGSACGAGDVTAFYYACFVAGQPAAACGAWFPGGTGTLAQEACGSCLRGSTPGSGAYVSYLPNEPDEVTSNQAACVLAADPSPTGTACAQDLLNRLACEAASCATCTADGSGGGTDPDGALISGCEAVADQGACAAYDAATTADCVDLDAGGAAAACNSTPSSTFESDFIAFAMVLCGGS